MERPAHAYAALDFEGGLVIPLGIDAPCKRVYAVQLPARKPFNLLLQFQFQGVKAGNMHLCGCVFQLPDPLPGQLIVLGVLDIFLNRPVKLLQFVSRQPLARLGVGDAVIIGKPLIPRGGFLFDLGNSAVKLLFKVLHVVKALIGKRLL